MPIYTGRGDEGKTDLQDMSRVSKASPRIEAYGTVDEVNALLGRVRPTGEADVDEKLEAVQNDLFVVQADLANPDLAEDGPRMTDDRVERLEAWMDEYDEELPQLRKFILPGGSEAGAELHHARTVCRRAERRAVTLATDEEINETTVRYLNRLSDALFVLARVVNARAGEPEENPTY